MEEMEKNVEALSFAFPITSDEVADTLNRMDAIQGMDKKQKVILAVLLALAMYDFYQFITTKSGFALILGMLFIVIGIFYKQKSSFSNRKLGEAFAADAEQIVKVGEEELQLTDRATKYEDITVMYEFKDSFGFRYMGNYYFVIPKRVFADSQLEQFRGFMQEKLQECFVDKTAMR